METQETEQMLLFILYKAIWIPTSFMTVGMKMSKGDVKVFKVLKNHILLNFTVPSLTQALQIWPVY